MASKTRKLRTSIKAILEPALEEAGFTVDYPNFRRIRAGELDVVDVQPWKDGGAFIINAARFDDLDALPEPPERAEVGMVPMLRQERFGPPKSKSDELPIGWYKYEHIHDDKAALDHLVREVAGLIPQIEAWLESGTLGPNADPENSWRTDTE